MQQGEIEGLERLRRATRGELRIGCCCRWRVLGCCRGRGGHGGWGCGYVREAHCKAFDVRDQGQDIFGLFGLQLLILQSRQVSSTSGGGDGGTAKGRNVCWGC